jgi:hypothetical protein
MRRTQFNERPPPIQQTGQAFDVGETFSGVDYETGLRAAEGETICPPGMSQRIALRGF